MYITTGTSKRYTVLGQSIGTEVRYTLAEAPAALGETVKLWTADGTLCLRTDAVADYQYPRIDGSAVLLSNTPEPGPAPEPAEPGSDPLADLAETVAGLIYQMDLDKLKGGGTL